MNNKRRKRETELCRTMRDECFCQHFIKYKGTVAALPINEHLGPDSVQLFIVHTRVLNLKLKCAEMTDHRWRKNNNKKRQCINW